MKDEGETFIHSAAIGRVQSEKTAPDATFDTVFLKIAVGSRRTPAPSTLMPILAPTTRLSNSSPPTMFRDGYHGPGPT